MSQRSGTANATPLNTLAVSPLVLVRGYASSLVSRVRSTIQLAQMLASAIQSVDIVSEQVEIDLVREDVSERHLLRLPIGQRQLGLGSDVRLERSGNVVMVRLAMDAFLLESAQGVGSASSVSQAVCRIQTRLRVLVHETIDMSADSEPARQRKRLTGPRAPKAPSRRAKTR